MTGVGHGRARPGHPQRPARAAGLAVRLRLRPARPWPSSSSAGAPACCGCAVAVFVAAAVAGARLPVPRRPGRPRGRRGGGRPDAVGRGRGRARSPASRWPPTSTRTGSATSEDLAAFRPIADTEVILALMPMSVLKALVGFLTFLFAFGLRRGGCGHLVVRLRPRRAHRRGPHRGAAGGADPPGPDRAADADRLAVAGGGGRPARVPSTRPVVLGRVALAVGVAGAVAKPSFDALVQRHVRESDQGRAFARFETRLQLMWVVGSLVPRGAVPAGPGRQPGHGRRGRGRGASPT